MVEVAVETGHGHEEGQLSLILQRGDVLGGEHPLLRPNIYGCMSDVADDGHPLVDLLDDPSSALLRVGEGAQVDPDRPVVGGEVALDEVV